MIHSTMNEEIESKMVGPVADLCIKINKVFSHTNPFVIAIPRDMREDIQGVRLRTPQLWSDITIVKVNTHGELLRTPTGSYGHVMYLSSIPANVTKHSDYTINTLKASGSLIDNTSYPVMELESGEIQINRSIFSVPEECAELEYEENPLDDFPTFLKKTQPSTQSLKTRHKNGKKQWSSNVQSIFKRMEAGVAEEITTQLATNRSLKMFEMLDPDVEYVALDTPRILKRWWTGGDLDKKLVNEKGNLEARGAKRERLLQDDHGVDIIVMPMARFLDRKNIPTVEEFLGDSYLRLQIKGAPIAHAYNTLFCEVQTHLAAENEIVPSGLDKTKAQWTGYVMTSNLTAWLPSSEYKRLAYATNKEPSPSSKVRAGYDKTSLGMRVECRAVFEHPSLCATILPERYASAFNQISYCAVKEYLPKSQASVGWLSLEAGDFIHFKGYKMLAQDWTLGEYELSIRGRLSDDRITGKKEVK